MAQLATFLRLPAERFVVLRTRGQRDGRGCETPVTIALMVTRGIRDFVARDWEAVRESKDAYWADRIERMGPEEALRVADELRRQMLQCAADWPDDASRQADLESHVRLAALLRRADPSRRG